MKLSTTDSSSSMGLDSVAKGCGLASAHTPGSQHPSTDDTEAQPPNGCRNKPSSTLPKRAAQRFAAPDGPAVSFGFEEALLGDHGPVHAARLVPKALASHRRGARRVRAAAPKRRPDRRSLCGQAPRSCSAEKQRPAPPRWSRHARHELYGRCSGSDSYHPYMACHDGLCWTRETMRLSAKRAVRGTRHVEILF